MAETTSSSCSVTVRLQEDSLIFVAFSEPTQDAGVLLWHDLANDPNGQKEDPVGRAFGILYFQPLVLLLLQVDGEGINLKGF